MECEHIYGHSACYDRLICSLSDEIECLDNGQDDDHVYPYTKFKYCPGCGANLDNERKLHG